MTCMYTCADLILAFCISGCVYDHPNTSLLQGHRYEYIFEVYIAGIWFCVHSIVRALPFRVCTRHLIVGSFHLSLPFSPTATTVWPFEMTFAGRSTALRSEPGPVHTPCSLEFPLLRCQNIISFGNAYAKLACAASGVQTKLLGNVIFLRLFLNLLHLSKHKLNPKSMYHESLYREKGRPKASR